MISEFTVEDATLRAPAVAGLRGLQGWELRPAEHQN